MATKEEALLETVRLGLKTDVELVESGEVSSDILGTLGVNYSIARKRFPDKLADLISRADVLLKKHQGRRPAC